MRASAFLAQHGIIAERVLADNRSPLQSRAWASACSSRGLESGIGISQHVAHERRNARAAHSLARADRRPGPLDCRPNNPIARSRGPGEAGARPVLRGSGKWPTCQQVRMPASRTSHASFEPEDPGHRGRFCFPSASGVDGSPWKRSRCTLFRLHTPIDLDSGGHR
jgi:hypothetical protein